MNRRIVQTFTTGPHPGLHQIIGLESELQGAPFPAFLDGVDLMGRRGSVTLTALRPRYVLYTENAPDIQEGQHGL